MENHNREKHSTPCSAEQACASYLSKTSSSVLQEAGRDGTFDQEAYSGYTDDCDKLGSDTCPRTRLGGPTKIHFTVDGSQSSRIRGTANYATHSPGLCLHRPPASETS